MCDIPLLLIGIVVLALVFDYTNGAHDCANAVATIISTRVLDPRIAIFCAALLNLIGAFLGTEVARTVGSGILYVDIISHREILVLAALTGAIVWNTLTWILAIPSSSSHALVGGLIGAGLAQAGTASLNVAGIVTRVLIPLFAAPLAAFCTGFLILWIVYWIFSRSTRRTVDTTFRRVEFLTAGLLAVSHGLNDAQKTMGIVTLALLMFGFLDTFVVPFWVKLACAGAMALGTALGGLRIIRTMGSGIFRLKPVHGVCAEVSAACVIAGASVLGAPVSTTHTISAGIVGVGTRKRLSAVRWIVARNLVIAWILTLPSAACTGFLVSRVLQCLY